MLRCNSAGNYAMENSMVKLLAQSFQTSRELESSNRNAKGITQRYLATMWALGVKSALIGNQNVSNIHFGLCHFKNYVFARPRHSKEVYSVSPSLLAEDEMAP